MYVLIQVLLVACVALPFLIIVKAITVSTALTTIVVILGTLAFLFVVGGFVWVRRQERVFAEIVRLYLAGKKAGLDIVRIDAEIRARYGVETANRVLSIPSSSKVNLEDMAIAIDENSRQEVSEMLASSRFRGTPNYDVPDREATALYATAFDVFRAVGFFPKPPPMITDPDGYLQFQASRKRRHEIETVGVKIEHYLSKLAPNK
jgi:hypothetical protein